MVKKMYFERFHIAITTSNLNIVEDAIDMKTQESKEFHAQVS